VFAPQNCAIRIRALDRIGVASEAIEEGEWLDSARLSEINTEISLLGIVSADIVLTGGGPSSSWTPFHFSLENVVEA